MLLHLRLDFFFPHPLFSLFFSTSRLITPLHFPSLTFNSNSENVTRIMQVRREWHGPLGRFPTEMSLQIIHWLFKGERVKVKFSKVCQLSRWRDVFWSFQSCFSLLHVSFHLIMMSDSNITHSEYIQHCDDSVSIIGLICLIVMVLQMWWKSKQACPKGTQFLSLVPLVPKVLECFGLKRLPDNFSC